MYQQLIKDFVQQEQLPSSYLEDAARCFLPIVQDIKNYLARSAERPQIIGINGAQGTGKSTLAKLLAMLLKKDNCAVANLSIDDFYLSKAQRESLANTVHPLLKSRGVPGTHDVGLALGLLVDLSAARSTDQILLPKFDKANDDCLPESLRVKVVGPIDVIILEGWFVGVAPQPEQELKNPVNDLEQWEDKEGKWRAYVNAQLAGVYQSLFAQLDILLMLKAPGFEQVLEWRNLQEQKLRMVTNDATSLMNEAAIRRFIQHFERLTRHCLNTLPEKADRVFELDARHRIHCIDDAAP